MRRVFVIFLAVLLCIPAVRAEEPVKYVALTFDDGPSGQYTQRLLEGLARRGIHATFFLCGYRLETYPELAAAIRAGGHEIGLHGYSHKDLAKMDAAAVSSELVRTQVRLPEGTLVNLMRSPGGSLSNAVHQAAENQGLAVIQWSVDPEDWAIRDAALVHRRVVDQAADGAVILLHDMSDSSVDGALAIVDTLLDRGYRFLTVSQLAMLRLTHLRSGQKYSSFGPAF